MLRPLRTGLCARQRELPVLNDDGSRVESVLLPEDTFIDDIFAVLPDAESSNSWWLFDKNGVLWRSYSAELALWTDDAHKMNVEQQGTKRTRIVDGKAYEKILDMKRNVLVCDIDYDHKKIITLLDNGTVMEVYQGEVKLLAKVQSSTSMIPTWICCAAALNGDIILGTQEGLVYNVSQKRSIAERIGIAVNSIVNAVQGVVVFWNDGNLSLITNKEKMEMIYFSDIQIDGAFNVSNSEIMAITRNGGLCLFQICEDAKINSTMISITSGRVRSIQGVKKQRILVETVDERWHIFAYKSENEGLQTKRLYNLLDHLEYLSTDSVLEEKMRQQDERARLLQTALELKTDRIRCMLRIARRGEKLAFGIKFYVEDSDAFPGTLTMVACFTLLGQQPETISREVKGIGEVEITPECYTNACKFTKMLPIEVKVTGCVKLSGTSYLSRVCAFQTFDALDTGALEVDGIQPTVLSHEYRVAYFPRVIWPVTLQEDCNAGRALRDLLPLNWNTECHTPHRASAQSYLTRIMLTFDGPNVEISFKTADSFSASILHHALLTRLRKVVTEEPPVARIRLQAKRIIGELYNTTDHIKDLENMKQGLLQASDATRNALKQALSVWNVIRKTSSYD